MSISPVFLKALAPQDDLHGVSGPAPVAEDVAPGSSEEVNLKCVASNEDFQALRFFVQMFQMVQQGNAVIAELQPLFTDNAKQTFTDAAWQLQGEDCKKEPVGRAGLENILRRTILLCLKDRLGNSKKAKDIRDKLGFPKVKNQVKSEHESLVDQLTLEKIDELLAEDHGQGLNNVLKDVRAFVIMLNMTKTVNRSIQEMQADVFVNDPLKNKITGVWAQNTLPLVQTFCAENNRVGMKKILEDISGDVLAQLVSELNNLSCTQEIQTLLGGMSVDEFMAQENWIDLLARAMIETGVTVSGPLVADGEQHKVVIRGIFCNFNDDTEISVPEDSGVEIMEIDVLNPSEIEVTYVRETEESEEQPDPVDFTIKNTGTWYTAHYNVQSDAAEAAPVVQNIVMTVDKDPIDKLASLQIMLGDTTPKGIIQDVEQSYIENEDQFFAEAVEKRSTLDKWTDELRKIGLSPVLSLQGGMSFTPLLDSRVLGEPGSNSGAQLNLYYGVAGSLGWSPNIGQDYKLTLQPYGAFYHTDMPNSDDSPSIMNLNVGSNFYLQRKDAYSYLPNLSLGLSYLMDSVGIPTPVNPEGKAFELSFGFNETLYKPLSLDLGLDFMYGKFNGRDWRTTMPSGGLRLNFDSMSIMAGYRFTWAEQERIFLSGDGKMQATLGHGLYGGALLGFGQAGTLKLFGSYDFMDTWNDQAALALEYTIPFSVLDLDIGASYKRMNLNNGVSDIVLGKLGISNLPLLKGGSKGGLNLYGGMFVEAGYRQNKFNDFSGYEDTTGLLPDDKGAQINIGLELTFGIGPDGKLLTENGASNAMDAWMTNPVDEESQIFNDPLVNISERVFNNYVLLKALAFKLGCLDEDYELDESKLREVIEKQYEGDIMKAITAVDSGDNEHYGYEIKAGKTVAVGDVAPFGLLLGNMAPNLTGKTTEADWEKSLLSHSPRKLYVTDVLCPARAKVAEEESIAVNASNEATWLAWKTLAAVAAISDYEPGKMVSVKFFVESPTFWSALEEEFVFPEGVEKSERKQYFTECLYTELSGKVVGQAVMAVAKAILKKSPDAMLDDKATHLTKQNVLDLMVEAGMMLNDRLSFHGEVIEAPEEAPKTEIEVEAELKIGDGEAEAEAKIEAGEEDEKEKAVIKGKEPIKIKAKQPPEKEAPAVEPPKAAEEPAVEPLPSADAAEDEEAESLGIE